MEIKDYSARLADARDNFKRDVRNQKESYHSDLKAQEINHKNVEKKHFEANTTKLQEISDDSSARIDKIDKRLADKMKLETSRFRDGLEHSQKEFNDDRNDIKQKFDTRLSQLRDGYSKSKNALTRNYTQQVGDIDDRSKKTRDTQALSYDTSVRDVANSYSKKFDDYRATEDFEKKLLIRTHDSNLEEIAKKDAQTRNKAAIGHQEDLNNLRTVAKEERSQMKHNQASQIDEIKTNQKIENRNLNQNFTKLTNDITERNDSDRSRSSRKTKELLKTKDRDFSKNVYQLKREYNEKLNGGGAVDRLDNRVAQVETGYVKRIDRIKEGIEDANFKNLADKERVGDENLNQMRNSKIKQRSEVENLKKNFENIHAKSAITNKKDMSDLVKTYRNELNKTIRNSEEQRISSRIKSKNLLKNQRSGFHETITKLSEKNTEAISSIKDDTTKEKSKLIEDYKIKLHNETETLKNDLKSSFVLKEESWDKRLVDKKSELEKIVTQYESKIDRLNKKNAKELVATREIQEQKEIEQKRSLKIVLADKERQYAFDQKLVKGQFEKRISDSKNGFDERTNKLVERYESLLDRQRKELTNDMRQKVTAARSDYDRLYKHSEADKTNLIFQNQLKLDTLRQSNDQAIKRLTTQNRLETIKSS